MTVGELAEQLNELYTYAAKRDINIENYDIVITDWHPEVEIVVHFDKQIVEFR